MADVCWSVKTPLTPSQEREHTHTTSISIIMLWHFAVSGGWGYFKCLHNGTRVSSLAVQIKVPCI